MADKKGLLSPNNVMAALRWLGRTPESFMPGHPDASAEARFPTDSQLTTFWDFDALRLAVETRRAQLGMTLAQVATDIGVPVATVRTLLKGGGAGFPPIMRFTTWLGRPATVFLHSRRAAQQRLRSRLREAAAKKQAGLKQASKKGTTAP
jgi:transcriptional regulator with XRE-family HTH domain